MSGRHYGKPLLKADHIGGSGCNICRRELTERDRRFGGLGCHSPGSWRATAAGRSVGDRAVLDRCGRLNRFAFGRRAVFSLDRLAWRWDRDVLVWPPGRPWLASRPTVVGGHPPGVMSFG